jgi:hypothetical protein
MGGRGTCAGQAYDTYATIETVSGETATVRATDETVLLVMVLPMLRAVRAQGDHDRLAAE